MLSSVSGYFLICVSSFILIGAVLFLDSGLSDLRLLLWFSIHFHHCFCPCALSTGNVWGYLPDCSSVSVAGLDRVGSVLKVCVRGELHW